MKMKWKQLLRIVSPKRLKTNDLEAESDNQNSDSESTTIIQQKDPNPCQQCEGSNVYHTAVMNCPKCFWHDDREICRVCSHNIPMDRKHMKEKIERCIDCGAVTHYNRKESKSLFTLLKKRKISYVI